jgi:hypothetical protein
MADLTRAFPEYMDDQIRGAWSDLRSYGLVGMEANSLGAMSAGVFENELAGSLTPFGRAFVAFIRNPVSR